jgi:hypothetical protein
MEPSAKHRKLDESDGEPASILIDDTDVDAVVSSVAAIKDLRRAPCVSQLYKNESGNGYDIFSSDWNTQVSILPPSNTTPMLAPALSLSNSAEQKPGDLYTYTFYSWPQLLQTRRRGLRLSHPLE